MIAVAVSVSVVGFTWSQGFLANSMQASDSMNEKASTVLGAITIESISINNATQVMTMTVRNIGISSLHVESVIVQNNDGFSRGIVTSCALARAEACGISIYNLSFKYRDYYTIKVLTLEGASAVYNMFVDA